MLVFGIPPCCVVANNCTNTYWTKTTPHICLNVQQLLYSGPSSPSPHYNLKVAKCDNHVIEYSHSLGIRLDVASFQGVVSVSKPDTSVSALHTCAYACLD